MPKMFLELFVGITGSGEIVPDGLVPYPIGGFVADTGLVFSFFDNFRFRFCEKISFF